MKLICYGNQCRNGPNGHEQGRYFYFKIGSTINCPPQKCRKNRVLGQMRAFANNELDRRNCCIRNAGSEPAEERTDESRGVFRGKQIGGADEDENHPGEDRQPEFEKSAHRKRNHNRAACANFAA